jgi:hypothetical protein
MDDFINRSPGLEQGRPAPLTIISESMEAD